MPTSTRSLATSTLRNAARDYAGQFLLPTKWSPLDPKIAREGRDWVVQSLYNLHYKDEFELMVAGIEGYLGQDALNEFRAATKDVFTPRRDDVFANELEERLAMRPDGTFIEGKLGKVIVGERITGYVPYEKRVILPSGREKTYTFLRKVREPVYSGDPDWRQAIGADVTNIAASVAILMADACVDDLDSGTGAAVIQGRSGAQPADPDAATTGTLLFTLTCSDPAFGGAADQADGTVDATASAVTSDSSADATATLGYCRASSTNDGATPLDDKIDGSVGTSGASYNFNTLAIVSGATVALTSWVVTMPQGSTAT